MKTMIGRSCMRGVSFYDDLNGGGELSKDKVIEARKLEMKFLKNMRGYTKVDKSDVKAKNGKIITTKWIDTDKDQGVYRSRLVGREIKMDKRQDRFSPTPPLETLKCLIASCAKGQGGPTPKGLASSISAGRILCEVFEAAVYELALTPI